LKNLLSALLALALCITPASPQGISSMLPGPGTAHSTGGGGGGIAYSNSADLGYNGGGGNFSTSYTGSILTHGLLVACISGNDSASDTLTAVTYGGNALSLGAKVFVSGNRWIYLYYLLNPPSGSNTFAITQSGGNYLIPVVAEYSGVLQSSQPDAIATHTDNVGGTSVVTTVTVANNGSWPVLCVQTNSVGYSSGTNATVRVQDAALHVTALYDSNAPVSPGSYSMTANFGGFKTSTSAITSFQPG
jgi:hypothetical protein